MSNLCIRHWEIQWRMKKSPHSWGSHNSVRMTLKPITQQHDFRIKRSTGYVEQGLGEGKHLFWWKGLEETSWWCCQRTWAFQEEENCGGRTKSRRTCLAESTNVIRQQNTRMLRGNVTTLWRREVALQTSQKRRAAVLSKSWVQRYFIRNCWLKKGWVPEPVSGLHRQGRMQCGQVLTCRCGGPGEDSGEGGRCVGAGGDWHVEEGVGQRTEPEKSEGRGFWKVVANRPRVLITANSPTLWELEGAEWQPGSAKGAKELTWQEGFVLFCFVFSSTIFYFAAILEAVPF